MTQFLGYRRPDGRIGVRNIVAVISAMDNTNPCADRIASIIPDARSVTTPFGRTQIGQDFEITLRTLTGIGCHPNVGSVLVLGLSLASANALADRIRPCGKPVEVLGLQEAGNTMALTAEGARVTAELVVAASAQAREPCDFSDLAIAVECGGSDTTSGLAGNPTVGLFADHFIDAGGTIILSEPAEFMGGEHILAERAVDPNDGQRIRDMVKWFEDEAIRNGVDMRGTNPTPDNIAGGLTTLEEKSLGAIAKGGSRPVVEVIEYSERPSKRGLVIMNTPSAACESMTGLLGGGSQMIIFSTGRGNSIGSPISPTIKLTGNPNTAVSMKDNIDVDVSAIVTSGQSLDDAATLLWNDMLAFAQGKLTRCEVWKEEQLSVSRFGPSV
ncbi:MAG: UxaA family hydrolase [Hyphomicrobiaceae bacterium]